MVMEWHIYSSYLETTIGQQNTGRLSRLFFISLFDLIFLLNMCRVEYFLEIAIFLMGIILHFSTRLKYSGRSRGGFLKPPSWPPNLYISHENEMILSE